MHSTLRRGIYHDLCLLFDRLHTIEHHELNVVTETSKFFIGDKYDKETKAVTEKSDGNSTKKRFRRWAFQTLYSYCDKGGQADCYEDDWCVIRGRLFQLPTHSESSSRRNLHKLLDSLEVIPDPTVLLVLRLLTALEPSQPNCGSLPRNIIGIGETFATDWSLDAESHGGNSFQNHRFWPQESAWCRERYHVAPAEPVGLQTLDVQHRGLFGALMEPPKSLDSLGVLSRSRLKLAVTQTSHDEGYVSASTTPTPPTPQRTNFKSPHVLPTMPFATTKWSADMLSRHHPPSMKSWDCSAATGQPFLQDAHLPYLTEAPIELMEKISLQRVETLLHVENPRGITGVADQKLLRLSVDQLRSHLFYLVLGVESRAFRWNDSSGMFETPRELYVQGLSAEGLRAVIEPLLQCGKYARRLAQVTLVRKCSRSAGNVHSAFVQQVANVLHLHQNLMHAFILAERSNSLLSLRRKVLRMVAPLEIMLELERRPEWDIGRGCGVAFLQHLVGRAGVAAAADDANARRLVTAVFAACVKPFLAYLERWLYVGECCDPCGEFLIDERMSHLDRRDRQFWTGAFSLIRIGCAGGAVTATGSEDGDGDGNCDRVLGTEEQEEEALYSLFQDVFICGKSVHLLRLCRGDKKVDKKSDIPEPPPPALRIAYSMAELGVLKSECARYMEQSHAIAARPQTPILEQELRLARHAEAERRLRLADLTSAALAKRAELAAERRQRHDHYRGQLDAQIAEQRHQRGLQLKLEQMEQERIDRYQDTIAESVAESKLRLLDRYAQLLTAKSDVVDGDAVNGNGVLVSDVANGNDVVIRATTALPKIAQIPDSVQPYRRRFHFDPAGPQANQSAWLSLCLPADEFSRTAENVDNSELKPTPDSSLVPLKNHNPGSTLGTCSFPPKTAGRSCENIRQEFELIEHSSNTSFVPVTIMAGGSAEDLNDCDPAEPCLRPSLGTVETVGLPEDIAYSGFIKPALKSPFTLAKRATGSSDDPTTLSDLIEPSWLPLSFLVERSLLLPIRTQCRLVNERLTALLLRDERLVEHLESLRCYLFLDDGCFAHTLAGAIFDRLDEATAAAHLVNVPSLNSLLHNALHSVKADERYACHLSFYIKDSGSLRIESGGLESMLRTMEMFTLRYRVQWPLNLVLTEQLMDDYSSIFTLLLQLRLACRALRDVYVRVKVSASRRSAPRVRVVKPGVNHGANAKTVSRVKSAGVRPVRAQVDQSKNSNPYGVGALKPGVWELINGLRQQMQHFVQVLHDHAHNQLLRSWLRFAGGVRPEPDRWSSESLDGLYELHAGYVRSAKAALLLNVKSAQLLSIVKDALDLSLRLRSLLRSWDQGAELTEDLLERKVRGLGVKFAQYASFLHLVLEKVRARQPEAHHLHELLLALNFNGYYSNGVQ